MPSSIGVDVTSGKIDSFSLEVKLDPVAMAEMLRGQNGLVVRHLLEKGTRVKAGAITRVGKDTGRLRDSIVTRIIQAGPDVGVEVGSEVPYAWWHHEGSDAVQGKLMVFTAKDGTKVFTMKRVAIPPNRFLTDSIND